MSDDQLSLWPADGGVENNSGMTLIRASIGREIRYLLTISTDTSRGRHISPAGVAHSLGVCILEDWIVTRGNGKKAAEAAGQGMPRFVDVRLTAEQRAEFSTHVLTADECVKFLQALADDGYRVGVSWSGEHQTYTVSLTCRNTDSPNNGLCMTSFAGDLVKAVSLAVYKHATVTEEKWVSSESQQFGDFG